MSNYPPGKYSALLVGHQWPQLTSQTGVEAASTNRNATHLSFEGFSQLLNTKASYLASNQKGATADDIQLAFRNGEAHARMVADKNHTKARSYSTAHQSVATLRDELTQIAKIGDGAIESILSSRKPPLTKITEITDVVATSQTAANGKAAEYCGNVYAAIQDVLDADGRSETAREFVKGLGIDLDRAFTSPDHDAIRKQAQTIVNSASAVSTGATDGTPTNEVAAAELRGSLPNGPVPNQWDKATTESNLGDSFTTAAGSTPAESTAKAGAKSGDAFRGAMPGPVVDNGPLGARPQLPRDPVSGGVGSDYAKSTNVQALLDGNDAAPPVPPAPPASTQPPAGAIVESHSPSSLITGSASHTPAPSFTAAAPSPSAPSPMQSLSPEALAQSFNTGMQSGGPISAGTEALSHNAFDAVNTPVHHQPEFPPPPAASSATTAPTAGGHFAYETAAAPVPEATTNYVPPAQNPSAFYAAPMPAAPMATAAPVAPMGPLPAYGADLRPAITPVAPPPSAPPLAPSPASAPVSPAAGAGSLNQSSVVRQQPAAPNPQTPAAAVTENAVAAATAGAVAGAASARKAARTRLQSLIEAVARQEPKLRWAIGDREDGTTILTTDLASGWIPPHIEIPSGVQLLPPARRRGGLEAMLGDTTDTASWTPGQYLPSAADVDPVPMSFRSRQLTSVDDLNWELTQAANWRDGLPRLAHTLAKAGVAGTGILESEADLLRDHLHAIGQTVLESYADTVDAAAVANWQLLAAIDALIGGRKTELNYHFAWFQALSMAKAGGTR